MDGQLDPDFRAIVGPLAADRAWRRRIVQVRVSACVGRAVARLGLAAGRALGEMGTCFVGAPSAAWADVPTAAVRPRTAQH